MRLLSLAFVALLTSASFGQTSFCTGTADLAFCPCASMYTGNPDSGCQNSWMTGGVKLQMMNVDTVNKTVEVMGTGFTASTCIAGFLIRSSGVTSPQPFSDGLTCLASPTVRLFKHFSFAQNGVWPDIAPPCAPTDPNAWPAGVPSPGLGVVQEPLGLTGNAYYQLFYRNSAPAFCPPGDLNTSNGVMVVW